MMKNKDQCQSCYKTFVILSGICGIIAGIASIIGALESMFFIPVLVFSFLFPIGFGILIIALGIALVRSKNGAFYPSWIICGLLFIPVGFLAVCLTGTFIVKIYQDIYHHFKIITMYQLAEFTFVVFLIACFVFLISAFITGFSMRKVIYGKEEHIFVSGKSFPGKIWARFGWISFVVVVCSYLGMRFHLSRSEATTLCIFLAIPVILLIVAFRTAMHTRAKTARASAAKGIIRFALAGLVCVVLFVASLGGEFLYTKWVQHQCVEEAQEAVAVYLQQNPHPTLGTFQEMSGDGHQCKYPSLVHMGDFYITARRTALFSNGSVNVIIRIDRKKDAATVEVKKGRDYEHSYSVSHPCLKM